jgi:hypothetical protein
MEDPIDIHGSRDMPGYIRNRPDRSVCDRQAGMFEVCGLVSSFSALPRVCATGYNLVGRRHREGKHDPAATTFAWPLLCPAHVFYLVRNEFRLSFLSLSLPTTSDSFSVLRR